MKQYEILVNAVTYERVLKYLKALQAGESAGAYVQQQLQAYDLSHMSVKSFLEVLMRTKRPCIFAESAVAGNGTDWNREELSILGDIGVATPVTVYDDGKHVAPAVYEHPFTATLLFIPGALLQSRSPHLPADWNEVIHKNALNPKAYHALYHRRLYPLFCYANHCVGQRGKGEVHRGQRQQGRIALGGLQHTELFGEVHIKRRGQEVGLTGLPYRRRGHKRFQRSPASGRDGAACRNRTNFSVP